MSIPTVGKEPATVLRWYGTVLMNCHCLQDKGVLSLVIITGTGNTVACGNCGKLFTHKGYSIVEGQVQPVIDITLPFLSPEVH